MTLPELRDYVAEQLNLQSFAIPFRARSAYDPRIVQHARPQLAVYVVPREAEYEVNDETGWSNTSGVNIGFVVKLPTRQISTGLEDVPDMDPLLNLVADVAEYFRKDFKRPRGYRVEAVRNTPAYDPEAKAQNIFVSVIGLDLFGVC